MSAPRYKMQLQRNKTLLSLNTNILSCCKIWLPFKTFYLSAAVTALNDLGQSIAIITTTKPHWIQTSRNISVQFPVLRLGTYLKPAKNLQLLKVITWVFAKFSHKIPFIAFRIISLSSPKARYFPLEISIFRVKKKKKKKSQWFS